MIESAAISIETALTPLDHSYTFMKVGGWLLQVIKWDGTTTTSKGCG